MRYGSVCSGIEAATQAWHVLGWEPSFFSEIEAFPSAVLNHHYPSVPNLGDMTKFEEWPDHAIDLLVGGTPCQSFSVAGLRQGLADPRGNLMLTYLAIARRYQPRWLVWENVPGVLSSNGGRDFGTLIRGLEECGYHAAWRVLDAQFVRVDGFERAVPQRRRRVFVVGYLGDWRRAAAVLLEPEGMRGDPAPRREAGKRTAGTITASLGRRGGAPNDDNPADYLVNQAFGGGNTTGPIDVSTALADLTAHGQRQDFEVETFVAEIAATLPAGGNATGGERQPGMGAETAATMLVAHALRGEGFDASEDGTGRGTPIVPVFAPSTAATLTRGAESAGRGGYAGRRQEDESNLVAFDTTQITSKANRSAPRPGGPCHPLAAGAHPPAVAFDMRGREGGSMPEGPHHTANIRAAEGGSSRSYVAEQWAVRRLMPVECERLQGFPDNFTAIPYRNRLAADGPRYKGLGNSMAVNVMRWLGQRIQAVENISMEAAE